MNSQSGNSLCTVVIVWRRNFNQSKFASLPVLKSLLFLVILSNPFAYAHEPRALQNSCASFFSDKVEVPIGWGLSPQDIEIIRRDEVGAYQVHTLAALINVLTDIPKDFYELWTSHLFLPNLFSEEILNSIYNNSDLLTPLREALGDEFETGLLRFSQSTLVFMQMKYAQPEWFQSFDQFLSYFVAHIILDLPRSQSDMFTTDHDQWRKSLHAFLAARSSETPSLYDLALRSKSVRNYLVRATNTSGFAEFNMPVQEVRRRLDYLNRLFTTPSTALTLQTSDPYELLVQEILYPKNKKSRLLAEVIRQDAILYVPVRAAQLSEVPIEKLSPLEVYSLINRYALSDVIGDYKVYAFLLSASLTTLFPHQPIRASAVEYSLKNAIKTYVKYLKRIFIQAQPQPVRVSGDGKWLEALQKASFQFFKLQSEPASKIFPKKLEETIIEPPTPQSRPPISDHFTPFIQQKLSLSQLRSDVTYSVYFLRDNPFFNGQQQIVFSAKVVQEMQSAGDERETLAREWLQAIQLGIARERERGIKRLRAGPYHWAVKLRPTGWRLLGDRDEFGNWRFETFEFTK